MALVTYNSAPIWSSNLREIYRRQRKTVQQYIIRSAGKFRPTNLYTLNIYAVQQDTQSVLMSEFIQHLC